MCVYMLKRFFTSASCWKNFAYLSPVSAFRKIMIKHTITHWIYVTTPFLITGILFIIMEREAVLMMAEGKTSFLSDTSNSICMPTMLITSYFLGSIIPTWIKRGIDNLANYPKKDIQFKKTKKGANRVLLWGNIILLPIAILGSCIFVNAAQQNSDYWMTEISSISKFLYEVYLILCWHFSLCLLLYVLVGCYVIKKLLFNLDVTPKNISHVKIALDFQDVGRTIGTIISYGLLYIIGVAVIIINDITNDNLITTFDNKRYSIFVILLILIGFVFIALPSLEFSKAVRTFKRKQIILIEDSDIAQSDKEIHRKRIEKVSASVFESTISRLSLFLSVTGPIVPLLIELVARK